MADTDEDSGARLFRLEAVVSDGSLRIDVANHLKREVGGDEEVDLEDKRVHARGTLVVRRGGRSRHVGGNYTRYTRRTDGFFLEEAIDETVHGGVVLNAQMDGEALMGGAYTGTFVGPFLRICAWADYMCWGGWLEADSARMEIASLMIRSMMAYAHTTSARVTNAYNLVDDFVARNEIMGTFVNAMDVDTHVGSPGSGSEVDS